MAVFALGLMAKYILAQFQAGLLNATKPTKAIPRYDLQYHPCILICLGYFRNLKCNYRNQQDRDELGNIYGLLLFAVCYHCRCFNELWERLEAEMAGNISHGRFKYMKDPKSNHLV